MASGNFQKKFLTVAALSWAAPLLLAAAIATWWRRRQNHRPFRLARIRDESLFAVFRCRPLFGTILRSHILWVGRKVNTTSSKTST